MGMKVEEFERRILRAKLRLIRDHPFFGFLLTVIEIKPDSSVSRVLIHPDFVVRMNPKWAMSLSDEELEFVLCHVTLHYVLEHTSRMGLRDPRVWHLACDIAANNILEFNGIMVPSWSPYVPEFGDKSAEEIYYLLYSKNQQMCLGSPDRQWGEGCGGSMGTGCKRVGGDSGGNLHGTCEPFDEWAEKSFGEADGCRKGDSNVHQRGMDLKELLVKAYNFAKAHGRTPLGISEIVDVGEKRVLDWRAMLERLIYKLIPCDYAWHPPSKKSYFLGVYLPGVKKEILDIVVALDTSGSISNSEYGYFLREVIEIFRNFENVNITAIMCDAKVQCVVENLTRPEDVLEHLRTRIGYGGTDFRPVFEWVERNKPNCRLLIYFTDGMGDYPRREPGYPVIWVIVGDEYRHYGHRYHPPFGHVINVDLRELWEVVS